MQMTWSSCLSLKSLALRQSYCQSWTLTENYQKRQRDDFPSQGITYTFSVSHRHIETTKSFSFGLEISSTGNFSLAVKEFKENTRRAVYAIKKSIKTDTQFQIWLKIFKLNLLCYMAVKCEVHPLNVTL